MKRRRSFGGGYPRVPGSSRRSSKRYASCGHREALVGRSGLLDSGSWRPDLAVPWVAVASALGAQKAIPAGELLPAPEKPSEAQGEGPLAVGVRLARNSSSPGKSALVDLVPWSKDSRMRGHCLVKATAVMTAAMAKRAAMVVAAAENEAATANSEMRPPIGARVAARADQWARQDLEAYHLTGARVVAQSE